MKKENRKKILFRYLLVTSGILLLVTAIVYRLVDTTIISADEWNKLAMETLSRMDTIQPKRGDILAADGSVLATNLRQYTARMDFRASRFDSTLLADTIDHLADSMALAFPIRTKQQWREYLLKPLGREKSKRPSSYKIVDNISYADYLRLRTFPFFSEKSRYVSGIHSESKMRRINPYGSMAIRSIGRVSATKISKEVHGRSGLEMALDSLLYGKVGYTKKVPLTHGIVNWTDQPAINGLNIHSTIDIKMQDIVENELNAMLEEAKADWGVAVLMEVATGDIKAISNLELNVDKGIYIEGKNRAVLGYEPGSVIKPISMLIALENGAVTPNQYITTPSPFKYAGGRPIRDSHPVEGMPAMEVIERSSNVGMTRIIASKYENNPGDFYSALKNIGFLDPLHVRIGGERAPRIDSLGVGAGARIALSRQCYGYATEIPPLHTLAIYNAIANNGRFVRPRLVQRIFGANCDSIIPVSYVRDRICSENNAKILREMMRRVVTGKHGTARVLQNDNVAIAGKTGTAYTIEDSKYTNKKRMAFCGFFPYDKPKYSCIVLISNPRNGAGAARTSGTVLKNVALRLYSRGMLDNNMLFDATKNSATAPWLYATSNSQKGSLLTKAVGAKHIKTTPTQQTNVGVPSVVGFSIRDAIATLEYSGYNVAVKGSGCVVAQTPAAGSNVKPGTIIELTLKN